MIRATPTTESKLHALRMVDKYRMTGEHERAAMWARHYLRILRREKKQ